jgi:hypothetical protein
MSRPNNIRDHDPQWDAAPSVYLEVEGGHLGDLMVEADSQLVRFFPWGADYTISRFDAHIDKIHRDGSLGCSAKIWAHGRTGQPF